MENPKTYNGLVLQGKISTGNFSDFSRRWSPHLKMVYTLSNGHREHYDNTLELGIPYFQTNPYIYIFIYIYIYINRYIRISTIYTTERSYLYNPTSLTNWGTTLMHSSRSLPWFPGGPSANQSPIFLLVPMVKIPWNSIARGNSWCSWWYSIT